MRIRSRRLDVQISIMTSIIIIITSISVYFVQYKYSYENMMYTLYERVYAIYDHLDQVLDKETYRNIRALEDLRTVEYIESHSTMRRVKNTTGVRFLYTITMNDAGEFIYLLDGSGMLEEFFHPPGSIVNMELFPDMRAAWEGNTILTNEIHSNSIGKVFTTYFPIQQEDEVIGILVVAVDAEHQYDTYHSLRRIIPIMIGMICIVSFAVTSFLFRRISNPHYQDYANTDQLTNLKNRNSYDIDMQNMMATNSYSNVGILVADLNNLKLINDTLGHQVGDIYIKAVGEALKLAAGKREVVYRIGGDEFTVIFHGTPEAYIVKYMEQVTTSLTKFKSEEKVPISLAMGYAIYCSADEDLYDVYRRADNAMYADKKAKKMKMLV